MHRENGRVAFVTNKRKLINSEGFDHELEHHINASALSHVLGIPISELRYSIEAQCIVPLNDTHVAKQQIFDIRDLDGLSAVIGQNNDSGASTIVLISDLRLDRNLTSFGRLLSAVWSQKTPGRVFWSNTVPGIEIDQQTFNDWLLAELQEQCSGDIECYHAMAALHCGKSKLMSLVSAGRLECVDWVNGGRDQIIGASYLEYLESLAEHQTPTCNHPLKSVHA